MNSNRKRTLGISLLLAGTTLGVFWPVSQHEFISYDDGQYLVDNTRLSGGLSWATVAWAFRTGYGGNWHPLTWVSHALDVQFFGLNPGWHHLVSLLFHTANALLLFLVLQRLTAAPWRSAIVAALFAWHPLHVESVAWAAERKDVVSAFFFILTLWAYVRYVGARRTEVRTVASIARPSVFERQWVWYGLALVLFALGLMSKPMLVTVPFVLLLLDYWPLGRSAEDGMRIAEWRSLVIEKTPFLLLTVVSCVVTMRVQSEAGAVVSVERLSLLERAAGALVATTDYLGKTLVPVHLSVFYPRRQGLAGHSVPLSALVLVGITIWVLRARKQKFLLVGWFWFLGMLVPVVGLVQVGLQFMADRYTYLPLIGVFVMLVWAVSDRAARLGTTSRGLGAAAAVVLAGCLVLTRRQIGFWKDTETLFGHALAITGPSYTVLNNYGQALAKKGKWDLAAKVLDDAIQLDPSLDAAYSGLGEAMLEQGKLDEALVQFQKALNLHPDLPGVRLKIGTIYGRQGKLVEAAAAFQAVLDSRPDDAVAHNNLGNVLTLQGKHEEANPHFSQAVRLTPTNPSAHNNLGLNCRKLGRIAEAISEYREAVRLQPDFLEALNNLAWALASAPEAQYRNGTEAIGLATRACELTRYEHPVPLATLAVAYGETGQFPDAISFAQRALGIAGPQSNLAPRLNTMIEAFKLGRPYRES